MCFGSSNKTQSVQQQSSTDINPTFKPYYEDLAKRAKEASLQVSNQPYTGRFVAPGTPAEFNAIDLVRGAVTGAQPASQAAATSAISNASLYSGAGGATRDLALRTLGGEFTNPENPITQAAIRAATNPGQEALDRYLVRTGATAAAQGAHGGSRLDQIRNDAVAQFGRESGDIASKIINDFVTRERGYQNLAPQMLAQAGALESLPSNIINQAVGGQTQLGTTLGQAGELERGLNELEVRNSLLGFQEQQAAPNRPLIPYAQLLGAVPTTTTTNSTGTATTSGPSGFTQFLQGALGLGALGASFPWGSLGSAASGAATGGSLWGLPIPWA